MSDDRLAAFLAMLRREPFGYGSCDCALVLGAWAALARGITDPAAHLKGTYASANECAAVTRRNGHLPRLVARLARDVGLERTRAPQPGDIAVVRFGGAWFGAIRTRGARWAIKCNDGLLVTRECRVVAAWSV